MILINDKAVLLQAFWNQCDPYQLASDELKDDKEIALRAVSINGSNLKHASEALRNDKVVVLQAIKKDINAVEYASVSIQNIIDKSDPTASLEKMIFMEKFASKLSQELKPKIESQQPRIKI